MAAARARQEEEEQFVLAPDDIAALERYSYLFIYLLFSIIYLINYLFICFSVLVTVWIRINLDLDCLEWVQK